MDEGQRRAPLPSAGLLLHPHLRRPQGAGPVYVLNTGLLPLDGRRQDVEDDPRAARRQPRPLDRVERAAADDQRQRRRRERLGQRRRDLDRAALPDGAAVPRRHDRARARTTSAGRSRTTAPRACRSTGSGDDFYDVGGGESGYIAADPRNPDIYYAGSYGGLLTRYDRRTGQTRAVDVWPDNPMGHSSNDMRERSQWTFPIVFSPIEAGTLYVGSQHVWRTRNDGQSWERISPDLTRADPSTMGPSGGPITLDQTGVETYATIFTIAPSRREAGTIWVGTDDGYVQVTRDGGQDVAERDAGRPAAVRPHQPHRGVAARAGHRVPRRQPLPTRRPRALLLPDGRFREDVEEDRGRDGRRRFRAGLSARIRCARACCTPAPSRASTCRSTAVRTGSRCG